MASRECASCHTQINTCDVCGADWPSHMLDAPNGSTVPALMVCDTDWATIRAILGQDGASILALVLGWRSQHPQGT